MPGVYGPRDFSAWGWTQDPRFRRPEAWQNELPLSSTLLEQCVLVVSEKLEQPEWEASPPDLLKISPVGVLCTPTRTEALWWVDLLACQDAGWALPGWSSQAAQIKCIEQCNAGVSRACLVSGRSSKIGHRLPMGGGGVGFGSVAWGTNTTCQRNPLLVKSANEAIDAVMRQQVAVWHLFPKAYAALLACNQSGGLLVADPHATHGPSPVARHGVSHMHITSKGKDLGTMCMGFSCTPHTDTDSELGQGTSPSQFSLGVWWPLGAQGGGIGAWPEEPSFGYAGGVVGLSRPVACAFNSALPHCSSTTLLPPGCDIIGTSTEVSAREMQYRRKHPAAFIPSNPQL